MIFLDEDVVLVKYKNYTAIEKYVQWHKAESVQGYVLKTVTGTRIKTNITSF